MTNSDRAFGKIWRLLFPEPTENPVSAQMEALWMLAFSYLGLGAGGILAILSGYPNETLTGIGIAIPMVIFTTRFLSKVRGWDEI